MTLKHSLSHAALFVLVLTLAACARAPQTAEAPAQPPSSRQASMDGAVTLDWEPPLARLDGERMRDSEIAGYRIYVGRQVGRRDRVVEVADPHQTRHVVRGLEPGRVYYFSLTTVDRVGRESPLSEWVAELAQPLERMAQSAE